MGRHLLDADTAAQALTALTEAELPDWLETQDSGVRARLDAAGFKAKTGTWCQITD